MAIKTLQECLIRMKHTNETRSHVKAFQRGIHDTVLSHISLISVDCLRIYFEAVIPKEFGTFVPRKKMPPQTLDPDDWPWMKTSQFWHKTFNSLTTIIIKQQRIHVHLWEKHQLAQKTSVGASKKHQLAQKTSVTATMKLCEFFSRFLPKQFEKYKK